MNSRIHTARKLTIWDWSRQGAAISFGFWLMFLMLTRLGQVDTAAILSALGDIRGPNWGLAAIATAISFSAVARYDNIIARIIGLDLPLKTSRRAGISATAIAQSAGFGLVSGGFIRWRMYRSSGLGFWSAIWLTSLIAIGFLASLFIITAALILLTGIYAQYKLAAFAVLTLFTTAIGLSLIHPSYITRFVPPLPATAALIWVTLIDTTAAAAALWLLVPAGITIPFPELMIIYLIALGVAMICGSPFGFGPFEITILALLPHIPSESLLASLAAFRLVYYGLPILVAIYLLLRPQTRAEGPRSAGISKPVLDRLISNSRRADANLFHQGDKVFYPTRSHRSGIMAQQHGNTLVGLSDPFGDYPHWRDAIDTFEKESDKRFLFPCIYKASHALAQQAKSQGWAASRIGAEAVLNPMIFTLKGSHMRELRRKIRKSEGSSVTISEVSGENLPAEVAALSDRWASAQNTERSFSVGTFDTEYLKTQAIFIAYRSGLAVGFLSVFGTRHEESIDLLRADTSAPDGTTHALICAAIQSAKLNGCQRFSLCAAPLHLTSPANNMLEWVMAIALKGRVNTGLYRFKNSFRPTWENQYLVSKKPAMLLAVIPDIVSLIHQKGHR